MAPDQVDHANMTNLVMRAKQAKESLLEAKHELPKWKKRAELASKAGDTSLEQLARDKIAELEADIARSKHELEVVQQEKSMLRQEANLPDGHETAQAEALLNDFAALGVRPEDHELNELQKEQSADDMLAALKARLKDE